MRKTFLVVGVIIVAAFILLPFDQMKTMNPSGSGENIGWVSTSFAIFQCGVAVGGYSLTLPGLGGVNLPHPPFWVSNSVWNCEYPHL